MSRTIEFTDEGGHHARGTEKCPACCCPREECGINGCDGLVHLEVIGEEYDEDDHWWIHARRCDKCDWESLNNGEY